MGGYLGLLARQDVARIAIESGFYFRRNAMEIALLLPVGARVRVSRP